LGLELVDAIVQLFFFALLSTLLAATAAASASTTAAATRPVSAEAARHRKRAGQGQRGKKATAAGCLRSEHAERVLHTPGHRDFSPARRVAAVAAASFRR
jgi:hypothetical protein